MTQLVTLSCNLVTLEDPDDSEDDAQSESSEMGDFVEHSVDSVYEVLFVPDTDVECVTVHSK